MKIENLSTGDMAYYQLDVDRDRENELNDVQEFLRRQDLPADLRVSLLGCLVHFRTADERHWFVEGLAMAWEFLYDIHHAPPDPERNA